MTEHELERWTRLVVAEAHGRPLSRGARAERRRIEREHGELRREASLWAEFAELEQPRPGERTDAAIIADVLARASVQASAEPDPIAAPRPNRLLAPTLGLLLLAACVALGLAIVELFERGPEAADRSSSRALGGAAMAVDEAPVLQVATVGEHRLGRDDCRRAGASARLCARDHARFRIARAGPDHVELELHEGRLEVEVAAAETLVEVRTVAGLVRTRDAVELGFDPERGELTIDVLAGEAELIETDGPPRSLAVGPSLRRRVDPASERPPESGTPAPSPGPRRAGVDERPDPAEAPSPPTADELLAAAQRALAAGESTAAIERYAELIKTYPESRAARTASVSLGRLLLRAGRTTEALAAFERYLDSDATELIEEARYGRIRALRELERDAELAEAIEKFLLAHPGSIHRERLESWQGP